MNKVSIKEIETPDEVDAFVKMEILPHNISYEEWINRCYLDRMKEILTDPTEFGKVLLPLLRSAHCIQNADFE